MSERVFENDKIRINRLPNLREGILSVYSVDILKDNLFNALNFVEYFTAVCLPSIDEIHNYEGLATYVDAKADTAELMRFGSYFCRFHQNGICHVVEKPVVEKPVWFAMMEADSFHHEIHITMVLKRFAKIS